METLRPTARERRSIDFSWSIPVMLVTVLLLAACGGHDAVTAVTLTPPDDISGLDEAEAAGAGFVSPTPISVVTYEGSGQLVHPDAAVFPARWQGKRYWISATPYPAGNPNFENPSIYQGRRSNEMLVPPGVTNPVVSAPASGYMSDPDILHDPESDQLRMYYRETMGGMDQVLLITSQDGVLWSPARLVASAARYSLISPSIVRESATSWRMWTVNASVQGCLSTATEMTLQQRRSVDGITWGEPEPVNLYLPGRVPWHWDVQYVAAKQEYWALIAAYPDGTSCSRTAVYFARSADGTTWKVSPRPLLAPGEFEPLRDVVYRSSFHYHDGSDAVSVWFSGARVEGNAFRYAVASARYPYSDLLRRVGGSSPIILERDVSSAVSPELHAARLQFEREFP
ncbi:MAG: hypothetical protein ACJ79A_13145 [Gemmatimonadaceae bacterium]